MSTAIHEVLMKANSVIKPRYPLDMGIIFGSYVYGTATENSDIDAIVYTYDENIVGKEYTFWCPLLNREIDVHVASLEELFDHVDHPSHISILELMSYCNLENMNEFVSLKGLEKRFFGSKPSSNFVRTTISQIVSNSYVKSKKKINVKETYNREASLKSIFHCFRLLDFGIQIGKYGSIVNFSSCNEKLKEIRDMYERNTDEEVLGVINGTYKKELNALRTEFRDYFPKI